MNVPQIFDKNMKRLCYLDKASNIGYRQAYNDLWTARFKLPADDPKNVHCRPFNYVEIYDSKRRIELFRILPSTLSRAVNGYITYECEHVIATLIDSVLFKYHEIGNIGIYTSMVINWLLDKQNKIYNSKTKTWVVDPKKKVNWKLGNCEFNYQFLYKWENENICNALFSVASPFIEDWHFTYNTLTYPWTVNLVNAESTIGCEIRYKKNMKGIEKHVDPTNLVNRIFPLGFGESQNQLTIESVNNGIPYLEADTIDAYGVKESIWVDRRFQVAENLKSTAQSMLNELKMPYISYSVASLDLFRKTGRSFDEFKEGKIVRVVDKEDNINFNTKIVAIEKYDVTKDDVNVVIANKKKDVADSIANLQERARINETYAQGSATLMTIPYIDNADTDKPVVFEFYLPSSMDNINTALLRIQLQPFRGYTKAVKGGGDIATSTLDGGGKSITSLDGGGSTVSSSDGGSKSVTSLDGGGTSASTQDGGGKSVTSSYGGGAAPTSSQDGTTQSWQIGVYSGGEVMSLSGDPLHAHGLAYHKHLHSHSVYIDPHDHSVVIPVHQHEFTLKAHTHAINIPSHSHNVTIPTHTHTVNIPMHTHAIAIPPHVHDIEFGIFQGTTASSISMRVDATELPKLTDYNNIDIVSYLAKDSEGKFVRDSWHKIEIIPDRLTRISACLFLDIFTNSRGGGIY